MTNVTKIEQPRAEVATTDPMVSMIERVVTDPNADLEKLERMLAMKERMEDRAREDEDREAHRLFLSALAAAQTEVPVVVKNQANTHTRSRYADLAAIEEQAMPVVRKHGFSIRASSVPGARDGEQRVRFRVSHAAGHVDEIEDDFPLDKTGSQGKLNKTDLQAKGSTTTYARRYMLCGYFGIATTDDRDGNAPPAETISEGQFRDLRGLIEQAGVDESIVLTAAKIDTLPDLPASQFESVVKKLNLTISKKGDANG